MTEERGHGRHETRLHIVSNIPNELVDYKIEWKDFSKIGMAVSFCSEINSGKKEPEMQVRYYISSSELSAEKFSSAMRGHWSIESKLHWCLDVAMKEDDCRIRRGDATELLSGIRHIAVNILSASKEFKAGLRRKMCRAAMDRKYLASVLVGFRNRSLARHRMQCVGQIMFLVLSRRGDTLLLPFGHPVYADFRVQVYIDFILIKHRISR